MKVVNVSFVSGEVVIDTIGVVSGNFLVSKTSNDANVGLAPFGVS